MIRFARFRIQNVQYFVRKNTDQVNNYYKLLRVDRNASFNEIDEAFIQRIADKENIVENKSPNEIDVINGRSVRNKKYQNNQFQCNT